MFIELTEEAYEKFKPYLERNNFEYTVSDCTLPTDSIKHYHIDFGAIAVETARQIALQVDSAYFGVAKESVLAEKAAIEAELDRPKEIRKRKWDEKSHTVAEEAYGFVTGANVEETVERV